MNFHICELKLILNFSDNIKNNKKTTAHLIKLKVKYKSPRNLFPSCHREILYRRRQINDKFEGVLYKTLPNDSTNRFSIKFSNPDLYSKFIESLEKEIEPQQPVTEVISFQTRIEDLSCVITAHENESSISVKGPGSKLWRDTKFQLHATKLFQQYASETNEIIEGLQHPKASPK